MIVMATYMGQLFTVALPTSTRGQCLRRNGQLPVVDGDQFDLDPQLFRCLDTPLGSATGAAEQVDANNFQKDSWILIRADQTEEGGIEEQDLNVAKSKVSAQPNTLGASFAAVVSDVIWLKSRQFVLCEGVALN